MGNVRIQSRCRRFNRTTCGAIHQIPLKRSHFFMSRQRQTGRMHADSRQLGLASFVRQHCLLLKEKFFVERIFFHL